MPKTVPRFFRRDVGPGATRSMNPGLGFIGGPMSQAGIMVTPETALNFSAAFAAMFVISTDCAILPSLVYELTPGGGKRSDPHHPVAELLQIEPNPEVDAIHATQAWFHDALREGDGYQEIIRRGDGTPTRLYRIDPKDCEPYRNATGRLLYKLSNGKVILPENMLHLKGLTKDGIRGISVIGRARQTIGLGTAAEISAAGMFGRGVNVSGFLKTSKKLSPEAQEELRGQLMGIYGGPFNSGKPGILVGDYQWSQMGLNPGDGQFLATRAFTVIEICRWFNINPIKLMDYSNGRFSNIEQAQDDHVTTTLMPWLTFAEAEWNRKLLTAADRRRWLIRHDVDARLRGDSATRWTNYGKAFAMGCITPNQVCIKEDMNPFPGGDEHYLPVNNLAAMPKPGDANDTATGDGKPPADPPSSPAKSKSDPINDPARVPRDWERAVDAAIEVYQR